MTMRRFNLPQRKRYIFHRRIGINIHRNAWLIAAATVLGLLIAAGEGYLREHNLRLTRENELYDVIAASMRPPLGEPGTTFTDWREGTHQLADIKIKGAKRK